MNIKARELAARNILQGLEEFANFMSFQSTSSNLRIISVETVEQDLNTNNSALPAKTTAGILDMPKYIRQNEPQQSVKKSLSFTG